MKKIIVGLLVILFLGCSEKKPKQPEMLPQDEIPAYREAIKKMAKYIILEDSAYHFTISKDEALEKGIPENYYTRMQQELDFANYTIKEHTKQGIPITIPEYNIEE